VVFAVSGLLVLGATIAVASPAAADTPLSLAQPVYAATYVDGTPNLPSQVLVNTDESTTRLADVTWDLSDLVFDQHYRSYTVTGSVEGAFTATAQVETVPDSILYFIDSGMAGKTSSSFEGVKSLVGATLLNQAPDQASTAGSWGYVTTNGGYDGTAINSEASKDENGLYGKNSPSGAWLQYTIPDLPAGTYTLTTGHQEWWSGPRTITVSVTNSSNVTSTIASGIVVGSNPAQYTKTRMASNTFTQTAAGTATINVYRSGGTEGPAISWLAIAAGTVNVDTTQLVVSAPTAAPAGGVYTTAQTVTLASSTPDATIYYTTDGSAPSKANGTKYTVPFAVDQSLTVKALATKNGVASGVTSVAYQIEPVPADGYNSVPVGKTWYDTTGNSIQAHGGGFLEKDGWYYWVGENKTHNGANLYAVSLYRSQDLTNWEFVHDLITPSTAGVCSTGSYNGTSCKWERPKLVYNESTDTYVLWGHWETAADYSASHLIVATSPTIDGDYTIVRNFRPGAGEIATSETDPTYTGGDGKWGYGSRDFTVFKDPDSDDAYLVSAQDHLSMRLYKLTDDYTDVDWENSYPLFENQHREAPAFVKVGDYYYAITSSQSGWYPNQAMYSYTDDITDPGSWSALQPVGNNTTFYSQPTSITTLEGEDGHREYIYMGDRWNAKTLGQSNYVWLPLQIDGPEVTMDFHPEWSFDADTAEISYPKEELVSQGKPVTATQVSSSYPNTAANDGILYNLNTSGDNTNYYQPPGVPYSWTVDLEDSRDLSRIDLSFRSYNGSETYNAYTVWASNDNVNWTRLVSELANTTVGFKSNGLTGEYRYVRVDVTKVVNDHNGNDASWAAGLVEVQVYAAIPAVAPSAPASRSATRASDTSIAVSWTAPTDDGGSPVTEYRVYEAGASTPACSVDGTATSCTISGLALGSSHRYEVTAVNAVGEGPRTDPTTAILLPEVPSDDGATKLPGKGVLSSDNGWDTGLLDGSFHVTMNMWWGENGSLFKLYQDGTLVSAVPLTPASPGAQTAVVDITGLSNGTYQFTGVLVNSKGSTQTQPLVVVVKDAAPGKPVLSNDNWDNDGSYTVTANLWWGTNATSYRFYENGALLSSGTLTSATPGSQQAAATVSGKPKGSYVYTVEFINAAGTTSSAPVTVKVTK